MTDFNTRPLALGMLLLADPLGAEQVKGALRDAGFEATTASESGVIEILDDDGTGYVTTVDRALAGDDVLDHIHPLLTNEAEARAIGEHTAHLIVVATNLESDGNLPARRSVFELHARMLAALSRNSKVVGYHLEGTTVGAQALRSELEEDRLPVQIWAPGWVWDAAGKTTAYTFGLHKFGLPELQLVDVDISPLETYSLFLDVAQMMIEGAIGAAGPLGIRVASGSGVVARNDTWLVDQRVPAWNLEL